MGYTDEELNHQEQCDLGPRDQAAVDYLADNLRMKFLKDWALKANLELYKTDTERDWAYIVRREYRFAVLSKACADAMFFCSVAQCVAVLQARQVRWWPWAAMPVLAWVWIPSKFRAHNKRLFDLLNIGTEFELGAERNRVLEECNKISKRADF